MDLNDVIIVWTDGACTDNQTRNKAKAGVGVWFGENDPRNVSEPLQGTLQTNNRAELTGIIRAIEKTFENHTGKETTEKTGKTVIIRTDSNYCKNGIEKWIENWKKNGWKTARKKPVKNKDLWMRLDELKNQYSQDRVHQIRFEWVKGHSNVYGNEQADRLAVAGVTKIK